MAHTLVRFSRLISEAAQPALILKLLCDAAIEEIHADAAVVFRVTPDETVAVECTAGLDDESIRKLEGVSSIGSELSDQLLAACQGRFTHAYTLPLICSANLYGALVLLMNETHDLTPRHREKAEALADLTAISLNKTMEFEKLKKAYSDLRVSQEILTRSEKLRALGQMSVSIAHDLRNLFSSLPLQAELLRQERTNPSTVVEVADWIEGMAKHAIATVERLRSFSHQAPSEKELKAGDVSALGKEAVEICKMRLGPKIKIETEFGPTRPIPLRASDCVSALVNLILNARDAMPTGGTLQVRTGESKDGITIDVSDTGTGMSAETKQRLFEPFFTTKGKEGTGLGLPMVYAFVQRHRGRITADSEMGKGTTFHVWLPMPTPKSPSL